MFVSKVMVQKPAIGGDSNGNGKKEEIVAEEFIIPPPETEIEYIPPKEQNACDIGGS